MASTASTSTATFKIWRTHPRLGEDASARQTGADGTYQTFRTEVSEGMVVLDAVHQIQAAHANDLAVRWNCKAGKCGSCSAEINGQPRLMCMTRMSALPANEPITVEPMKAFPLIKDLVTDVSWNFRVKKTIKPFRPRPADAPGQRRLNLVVPESGDNHHFVDSARDERIQLPVEQAAAVELDQAFGPVVGEVAET